MDVINRGLVTPDRHNLDTVRALHQTVVSLRTALDKSRDELRELRARVQEQVDAARYEDTIEKLSLENHVLRQRAVGDGKHSDFVGRPNETPNTNLDSSEAKIESMDSNAESVEQQGDKSEPPEDGGAPIVEEQEEIPNVSERQPEVLNVNGDAREMSRGASEENEQSFHSETSQPELVGGKNGVESDNESEELDDIELIFTTDETKELGVLQEDLVSFSDNEGWQTGGPQVTVRLHEDSFDEADEKQDKIRFELKTWTRSVLVETDISKCGVVDENEAPSRIGRRNTLPNPLAYQPVIHRDAPNGNRSKYLPANRSARSNNGNSVKSPVRPILVERNSTAKRESGAQTDITALPSHWKSESHLARKISNNFTTLPSKFALPVQQTPSKYTLRLSDKTREARRTLLSDINFTSMVPELSRSADHLCRDNKGYSRPPPSYLTENLVSPGGFFRSRDYGREAWSPCDCNPYARAYQPPRYRGSLSSMPAYDNSDPRRRHSSSMYRSRSSSGGHAYDSVPTSPTRSSQGIPFSPSFSSRNEVFPLTPGYLRESTHFASKSARVQSRARNRVTFHESSFRRPAHPGQSLPDLRSDWGPESGDSTDSLIEEAEDYLRRSIDSILTGADWGRGVGHRRGGRRHSDPDPIREFVPPKSAQPFLPKVPRDLKLDQLVKVITSEGRVTVGRVRYVGTVKAGTEPFVGVELPRDSGNCDGSYHGRRYFDCNPDHGVFVPFKKVVMGWSF